MNKKNIKPPRHRIRHRIKHLLVLHIKVFLLVGVILLICLFIAGNYYHEQINKKTPAKIGVTYSPFYAKSLGLNPKIIYDQILNDLRIKHVRLNAYWDQIEPYPNQYDFEDLDYYLDRSGENGVKVILAVGFKLPRWPECFAPTWLDVKNTSLRQKEQLGMIQTVVLRYKNHPQITAWQVENEPLFKYGECPKPDKKFLETEIALVKSLSDKPVIITDSGELSPWIEAMKLSDIFGTTMYRTISNPVTGYFRWPSPTWAYYAKADLIRKILAPNNKKSIIAELQTEAWSNDPLETVPIEDQIKYFSSSQLETNIEFAKATGFDEIYLWGVEWWYYMKLNNHPEYLEVGREAIRESL